MNNSAFLYVSQKIIISPSHPTLEINYRIRKIVSYKNWSGQGSEDVPVGSTGNPTDGRSDPNARLRWTLKVCREGRGGQSTTGKQGASFR